MQVKVRPFSQLGSRSIVHCSVCKTGRGCALLICTQRDTWIAGAVAHDILHKLHHLRRSQPRTQCHPLPLSCIHTFDATLLQCVAAFRLLVNKVMSRVSSMHANTRTSSSSDISLTAMLVKVANMMLQRYMTADMQEKHQKTDSGTS